MIPKTFSLLLVTLFAGATLSSAAEPVQPIDVSALELKQSPFLLLTPAEVDALKGRIASDPATKAGYSNLIAVVDQYLAKPLRFPETEGGPRNALTCSECKKSLVYNPESPRRHFCAKCNAWREGERLDNAWNTTTFFELSTRMEEMGVAALLSGDARYVKALKEAWLDLAAKYPKYRLHEKAMRFDGEPVPTSALATCQSIEEGFFVSKLGYSWDALLGTKALSAQEEEVIQRDFWQTANRYFHRVMDLKGSGGNWWTWHAAGAMTTGVFSKDPKLIDRALNEPRAGMIPFLATGYIRSDGLVDERSATYQTFAMEAFSRMAHLSQRLGLGFHEDPRIRAGFAAYMQFLWPDYSVPCMNDTIRYRFAIDENNDKFGWARPMNLLDLGWAITKAPEILNILQVLHAVPTVAKNREHRLYGLIYGPADLKPKPFSMPPVFLPDSGIALLRSPEKDWSFLFKNNPQAWGGHSHPNALQIAMFANGEEFLPAFGAGNYAISFYGDWFRRTLAANTLSFNMLSQTLRGSDNQLVWGITRGPVQAAFGASRKLQGGTDPGPAAALNRLVLVTPIAMVEILRVEPDDTLKNKKVTVPTNHLDAVLHFSGTLAWNPPAQPAASPLELPSLQVLQAKFKEEKKADPKKKGIFSDPVAAYRLLENPQRLSPTEGGFLLGELSQPKGGKVALALFPTAKEESLWQFTGPGFEYDPLVPLPLVMRRLAANQARFGTVAVPFRGKNPLQSVKLLVDTPSATVLRVETANGSETIFHAAKAGTLSPAGTKGGLNGTLGVITESKARGRLYTLLGESLEDAAGRFSADKAVPVQMRLEGNKPVFVKLGEGEVTVTWTPAKGPAVSTKL